jgi:2-(1,2-epoxy-1,2-dihydrophenyl)acetyl-CoA isomerase
MTYQSILLEISGGVATLTLNRPHKKNALDRAAGEEIGHAIEALRSDPSVRALILTGAGGDFCAGGDIGSVMGAMSAEAGRKSMQLLHGWLDKLIGLDLPVIAAVDGIAFGMGFGLALAADMIIASSRARFCLSFMRIGLVPDSGVFYTLPRLVGMQRAKELVYSARELNAAEAREYGIALEVVASESLMDRARAMAASFAYASGTALALSKAGLNRSFESSLDSLLEYEATAQGIAFTTEAHQAAVRRFLDKQPTLFKWPSK